jgi:hypothetical protein
VIAGVSIEYPAHWEVKEDEYLGVSDLGRVWFVPPDAVGQPPSIRFEVYDRPLEQRATADPFTWQPNEGGYEVCWWKAVTANGTEGLEFIWGVPRPELEGASLNAIFYHESLEYDIRLSTYFDETSIELAATRGFTDTISQRYAVFEYIVSSLRFRE